MRKEIRWNGLLLKEELEAIRARDRGGPPPKLVSWTFHEAGTREARQASAWVKIQTATQLIEGVAQSSQIRSKSWFVATAICNAFECTDEPGFRPGIPLGAHQFGIYVFVGGSYGYAPGSIEDMLVVGEATLMALENFTRQTASH